MTTKLPIIIVDDDIDDQDLLREVLDELKIPNIVRFFDTCVSVLDYLLTTIEKPLLIISDINLPLMTGFQLRKEIHKNEYLRTKNIPFIFLSTSMDVKTIREANEIPSQGFFVKPPTIREMKEILRFIIGYWTFSKTHV
jgi:CheY-like chemotaxis protein